jgi:hypothetical protein
MAAKKTARKTTAKGTQSGTKKAAKKAAKRGTSKRELIDTGKDKRYVRRDTKGQFKEAVDVGRSLSQDKKHKAKTIVGSGEGDRGDIKR